MNTQIIGFFGPANPYGYFSQWYPAKFTINNIMYYNAEQYMMAEKAKLFGDDYIYNQILKTTDPSICKQLGRQIKNFDEDLWKENCEKIVYNGNLAKFSQNIDLKKKLLDTKTAILAEASPYDKIWGVGLSVNNPDFKDPKKWKGTNYLGKALMKVRDTLIK